MRELRLCLFFNNLLHLNYWISSASNYIFGSVVSYFLNKFFTFNNKNKSPIVILKFVINISLCYAAAYGLARPLAGMILKGAGKSVQENGAMLAGMGLFIVLNYIGQRFFVFKEAKRTEKKEKTAAKD